MRKSSPSTTSLVIDAGDFQSLIDALKRKGCAVVGPTLRDGAIVNAPIDSVDDLPIGWKDVQEKGKYRLERRMDKALFGYVVGPRSWKEWFHPAQLLLWSARREGRDFQFEEVPESPPRLALLGARSCDLHAVAIQDKVFLGVAHIDHHYHARRQATIVVAVNCTEPGATCFCASMGTGPRASGGFDLALTEIAGKDAHYFVVTVGSPEGAKLLKQVPHRPAGPEACATADSATTAAVGTMGRQLDTQGLKDLLYRNLEHDAWEKVAARCMACGNCTMVCPTCFCTTVEDVTDLAGQKAERHRKWDSCFTREFSYIYGGHIRRTTMARYRQWLVHKLGTWQDQFGKPGCVGCGRCITWCPAGIDLTEEVKSIRANTT